MARLSLQTERLLLRPFEASDAAAFHELMSGAQETRYTSHEPLAPERSEELLQSILDREAPPDALPQGFAIALRSGGPLIGTCRLARTEGNPDEADIAYFLIHRFWGQGLATEAARALIAYGWEQLHLCRIVAFCVPENVASRRVMEKVGMQPDGQVTRYAADGNWHQGAFRDVTYLQYALSWRQRLNHVL